MGTSVVDFGPYGFWLNDGHFELLLHLLAREVDHVADPAEWLLTKRDQWQQEATSGAIGCHSVHLDDLVSFPGSTLVVAGLGERVHERVEMRTEPLSAEQGVVSTTGLATTFVGDIPKEWFLQGLEAFIRLLKGNLQVTPEIFPVLPVTPMCHMWRPGDPEMARINQLWVNLEQEHFTIHPGESILGRVLTKAWESPSPGTQAAWHVLVHPENLGSLERWKLKSPFQLTVPLRKSPMQGLSLRDACEEALRQCRSNQRQ
jgi:hypothetical protein